MHSAVHSAQCTVHSAQCTVQIARCTVHSALCTVYTDQHRNKQGYISRNLQGWVYLQKTSYTDTEVDTHVHTCLTNSTALNIVQGCTNLHRTGNTCKQLKWTTKGYTELHNPIQNYTELFCPSKQHCIDLPHFSSHQAGWPPHHHTTCRTYWNFGLKIIFEPRKSFEFPELCVPTCIL